MYSYFKNCCCLNIHVLHHRMHVENKLAEIVAIRDHEFEGVIEEYEEILVQEEVPELPLAD